ncbi:hypothetical protein Tco_1525909 [Tanacetum coccineum]
MLLRIATIWVPLPKDLLGASSQRYTGCLFPKIYWVPLPKDILGTSSQRYTGCLAQRYIGCLFPKIYWVPLPKDILGASSQGYTECGGGAVGGGGVTATAVSRGDGGDGGRCGAWRSVE